MPLNSPRIPTRIILPAPGSDNTTFIQSMPVGHCPDAFKSNGTCRDKNTNTRHLSTSVATYDAEDFARDMADLVSCDAKDPGSRLQ